jgi:hypothetical protein
VDARRYDMILTIIIPTPVEINAPFDFPVYRSRLQGEYGISGFKKEYWKFESMHKVTKITEEMCQTTILTYDDPNADFVKDIMSSDMLYGHSDYNIISEKMYDAVTDRLIAKLFKS